jgi:hypothetical protein
MNVKDVKVNVMNSKINIRHKKPVSQQQMKELKFKLEELDKNKNVA